MHSLNHYQEQARDECVIEIDGRIFSPWVRPGDLVKACFSITSPIEQGLYVVSIFGHLTVWKLENNAWCCQQAGAGDSNRRRMLRRQEAGGYEVVGRVIRIFKTPDLEAMPTKPRKALPIGEMSLSRC